MLALQGEGVVQKSVKKRYTQRKRALQEEGGVPNCAPAPERLLSSACEFMDAPYTTALSDHFFYFRKFDVLKISVFE